MQLAIADEAGSQSMLPITSRAAAMNSGGVYHSLLPDLWPKWTVSFLYSALMDVSPGAEGLLYFVGCFAENLFSFADRVVG